MRFFLAITRNRLLMCTNAHVPFTAHFMQGYYLRKKEVSQSLIVSDRKSRK